LETILLDFLATQRYRCVVLPRFNDNGKLPQGVHEASWEEFVERFGATEYRHRLLQGLKEALKALRVAGCRRVYIDGSFVTAKDIPNDWDGCWDMEGVDLRALDPILRQFANRRAAQKAKYLGEFFPAQLTEGNAGKIFLEFFQMDKETGDAKGIVALDLQRLSP
jgi:hypothetical protein